MTMIVETSNLVARFVDGEGEIQCAICGGVSDVRPGLVMSLAQSGGWGDPSAPDMLRAYSLAFGVEVSGPRRSVDWGHEAVKQWLKTSMVTKASMGLVFSRECPRALLIEMRDYEKHEPGKGAHHGPDALRYFFAGWLGA